MPLKEVSAARVALLPSAVCHKGYWNFDYEKERERFLKVLKRKEGGRKERRKGYEILRGNFIFYNFLSGGWFVALIKNESVCAVGKHGLFFHSTLSSGGAGKADMRKAAFRCVPGSHVESGVIHFMLFLHCRLNFHLSDEGCSHV